MKLNIGSGRQTKSGYTNIDIVQYIDGRGRKLVDHVLDVEKQPLPFEGDSVDEILVDNVLEHLGDGLIFALNEMHNVLKDNGQLIGMVPVAGSKEDFMDITHKRHFIIESFSYICGENLAMENRPYHPRYADYGVLPWIENKIEQKGNLIYFNLTPNKKTI